MNSKARFRPAKDPCCFHFGALNPILKFGFMSLLAIFFLLVEIEPSGAWTVIAGFGAASDKKGSIMTQVQDSQVQPFKFRCRFEMTAADAPSGHEFCVFDFPGCKGCPKAQHAVPTLGSSEDAMKSEALRGRIACASSVLRSNK